MENGKWKMESGKLKYEMNERGNISLLYYKNLIIFN